MTDDRFSDTQRFWIRLSEEFEKLIALGRPQAIRTLISQHKDELMRTVVLKKNPRVTPYNFDINSIDHPDRNTRDRLYSLYSSLEVLLPEVELNQKFLTSIHMSLLENFIF